MKDVRIDLTAVNVINGVIQSLEDVTSDDGLRFTDSHLSPSLGAVNKTT